MAREPVLTKEDLFAPIEQAIERFASRLHQLDCVIHDCGRWSEHREEARLRLNAPASVDDWPLRMRRQTHALHCGRCDLSVRYERADVSDRFPAFSGRDLSDSLRRHLISCPALWIPSTEDAKVLVEVTGEWKAGEGRMIARRAIESIIADPTALVRGWWGLKNYEHWRSQGFGPIEHGMTVSHGSVVARIEAPRWAVDRIKRQGATPAEVGATVRAIGTAAGIVLEDLGA